jgi:hypothetical protein
VQRTLLILLVAASYLLLAGGRPWTLPPLLALAVLASLSSYRRTFSFPAACRPLDLALLGIAAIVALQLAPLPSALVAAVSPHAAGVRAALEFAPMTAPPAWTTLSLDPERTAAALASVALGILAFWTARAVFSAAGNTRSFCRALALMAALAAIAAVVQKAVAPKLLLFVVPPEARSTSPFGAFTNRNHFAAWLLLAATPVLGYLIARLRTHPEYARSWRLALKEFLASGAMMTAVSSVVTLGVMLVTLSRSALAGLGVAAVTAWHFGRPRMRFERTTLPARLGALGVLLLAATLFIDIDGWAGRLEQSFATEGLFGRLTIWRETWPIVGDFWLAGTGAGTYSEAMTHYQQTRMWVGSMQRWAHFNNAHSHYLQAASEGGLLLAIPVLAALAALVMLTRRAIRADKGEMFWVRVGAAAGLAGLAAQSIWEVSLTMPANAVQAGVLAGLVLCHRDPARGEPSMTPAKLTPVPAPVRVITA